MIDINLVKCDPPGSFSTALDVNVDNGERWCGMCARDLNGIKLHTNCPHCGHYLAYFQIMTDCTAIGESSIDTERKLVNYIKKYNKRKVEMFSSDEECAWGFDGEF